MSTFFQKMAESSSTYPRRMGQAWDDTETAQLLKGIHDKLTVQEIAKRHERTEGGILSRLRTLVWEYHSEGRSLEDIVKFTGLDEATITKTITRHKIAGEVRAEKAAKKSPKNDDSEIITILKDIQSMLKELVENTRPPKKNIVRKPEYLFEDD